MSVLWLDREAEVNRRHARCARSIYRVRGKQLTETSRNNYIGRRSGCSSNQRVLSLLLDDNVIAMLFRLGERLTLGGRFIKQWHKRSLLSNFTLKWISGGPKTELIYEHHKPGVIMLLKFFGASQLILWPYMNYAICDLLERKKTVRYVLVLYKGNTEV